MKILSVIDTLKHGGAESVMVNLATEMTQHEHMVVHFSSFFREKPSEYLIEKLKNRNIPIKDIDYDALENFKTQEKILDEFPADIVLYHWWGNDPLSTWRKALRKKRSRRLKFICIIHAIKKNKLVQEDYDFYVPVSRSASNHQDHISPKNKQVIYNGIDTEKFDVSFRRTDKDKFIIGRVSSLLNGKIPKNWIEIVNNFEIKNVHFVIAGEGPKRKEFLKKIIDLDIEDKFSLPGFIQQDDLPSLLSSFDLCCYVTDYKYGETHSLALLECAAAGLPIIAQPRGGIPEQVIHEKTGFLTEDIHEIKYYCELLAKDSNLRKKMSKEAREFGMQFSIKRQCKEYDKLFSRLLS